MKFRHIMKSLFFRYCAIVAAALLPACVPERVVWSPDGSRALLLAPDGLHLMDGDGKVGPLLFEGVSRAAWLPDGQRVAVATSLTITGWDQLVKTIPDARLDPGVADKVKAALSSSAIGGEGNWKGFEDLTRDITEDQRARALLYLRDNDPKLPDIAGALWPNVVDASYSIPTFQLLQLNGPAEANPGPILLYGKQGRMMEMRVAPGGTAVAITLTSHRDNSPESLAAHLLVASVRKDEKPLDLELSNTYIDWSPDGKSLLYLRPNGPDDTQHGTLSRQVVLDDRNQLLAQDKLPPREDLLQLAFDGTTRVRCVRDGRVFFATKALTQGGQTPASDKPDLYCLEPGPDRHARLLLPDNGSDVGDNLQYFEPSPDGSYIALPFGDGRISVLNVASGQVSRLQPKIIDGVKNELVSAPTWRGTSELTFARPAANGSRVRELVRYAVANGQAVILSKDWADDLRRDWLIPTPEDPHAGILP